ncbi:sucrase ferredoxin [Saccharopolyspora sp. HNM0983]|uniref:Sucrase ferredoxin n=1 Tax=Saccharopolyspora montiporae TaxID=2781240 RepID=A0A929B948_9PSEU|nr:sucrase ferredoxin [Saccharopolyspora sp. HNM0983]MBE9374490.1 sucrase ferredoxin [Saccharopolyspora sp. HNM0983]
MHATAPTCSALSAQLAEPLPGTAAPAAAWLCLEQPGPWGREGLTDSHLDPELGRELTRRTEGTGVRVQLIRRPGRHADTEPAAPREVLLAHTGPGAGWLRRSSTRKPGELLDLDFSRIAAGEHDGWGYADADPRLLVCTNGRRDRCCALLARPLLDELGDDDRVWESTHTGGHRFAPAGVLLPSGYAYGRLDADTAIRALDGAADRTVELTGCRGRSSWPAGGQAAELAVRERTGERGIDALRVRATGPERFTVEHTDGRRWRVSVREHRLEPPRPNSCGKDPALPEAVSVTAVTA